MLALRRHGFSLSLCLLGTLLMIGPSPSRAQSEPAKAFAAGSLMAALTELIAASGLAGEIAKPVFGPAGGLRQRIEKGGTG